MKKILRWIWLHVRQIMIACVLGLMLLALLDKISFSLYFFSLFAILFFTLVFNRSYVRSIDRSYSMDCDPEPYLETYLAYIHRYRNAHRASIRASLWSAHLSVSSALSSLGRDREAKEYLDAIDTSNLPAYYQFVYQHDRFVISHRLGYANWAVYTEYLDLAESVLEKGAIPQGLRELASDRLLYDRLLLRFWRDGTSEEIERRISELLSRAKVEIDRVSFRWNLAQCALSRGDYAAAREHLEYVVAHGNKLYARTEAEELLRTLPEG